MTTRLHVGHLTRNVTEDHISEIFSTFGPIKSVELSVDKVCGFGAYMYGKIEID